jgi:hypothetical protein
MKERLPTVMFFVGLVVSDLTYRLTDTATYRALVGIMVAVTGLGYVLRETNALVGDYGFPLAGGFAAGGVIKWVVWTLMA